MKDPAMVFAFEGALISGETVRSTDGRFKGKPLIVDIMGTWCHNCQDEAPLLQDLQTQYGKAGLQVVGISFEVNDDAVLGKKNLQLYQERLGVTYTLLFCGSIDDSNVKRRLRSQLNNFFAYPTTLFIGRDGKVKAIHSGFKGPGTGAEFQSQIRELHQLAEDLLK
jgi:thiol-disulfide isomerase/thioredoxin